MIAIRVCPICKKAFEGRVGVPKVYCDECTMLSDYAAMDTARSQAAWFFEDFGDEDEREDEKHERYSTSYHYHGRIKTPKSHTPKPRISFRAHFIQKAQLTNKVKKAMASHLINLPHLLTIFIVTSL